MVKTWQLSLGPIDEQHIKTVIFMYANNMLSAFDYPKGNANMKEEPEIGDRVIATCKSRKILRGFILQPFHMKEGRLVASVMIESLEDGYKKGYRRNWAKIEEVKRNSNTKCGY